MERNYFFKLSSLRLYIGFFILSGCASLPYPSDYGLGYREVGLASWYGRDFHGRPTSNGEIYNMFGLSAAHKTLPFGTLLRVTDRKSGRAVEVRVNDRGPFVGRRILDLSFGAAKALGIVEKGVVEVEIEITKVAPLFEGGSFVVQVGAYQVKENALRMKEKVGRYYEEVYLESYETNTRVLYRVRIGPFRTEKRAQSVADQLPSQISVDERIQPVVIRHH